jgi:hypothetical protein
MLLMEIIAVYSENHTKLTNTVCGQNAELLIIKAGGTYSSGRDADHSPPSSAEVKSE